MKEWLKKTIRWVLDTYEEADSIDPWRGEHASNPSGIRLFDLTAINLQDHGYYPRLYRSGNMLVVYRSRWARLIDRRVGTIAFEINGYRRLNLPPINNGLSSNPPFNDGMIWAFGFGKPWSVHAGTSVKPIERPRMVCHNSDPFALERILEVTNDFYASS